MSASSETIKIHCSCGEKLKVPRAAIGKKGRCPKCQQVITITAPAEEAPPAVPVASGDDDLGGDDLFGGGLLDDLARQEAAADADESAGPRKKACGHCGKAMPTDAVVCTACGFNESTGKVVQPKVEKAAKSKPKAAAGSKSLTSGMGSFGIGCVCSLVGALIGAAIWAGVLVATEYEVAYIAIGLGFLAGLGMSIGYKDEGVVPGLTAVGMALFGILVAKGAAFYIWNSEALQSDMESMSSVASMFEENDDVDEIVDHDQEFEYVRRGIPPFDADAHESIWDKVYEDAVALTEEERADRKAEIRRWNDGGRWENAEHVRDYAVHQKSVNEFLAAEVENENADASDDEADFDEAAYEKEMLAKRARWNDIRKKNWTEVEQMADEDRLALAKELLAQADLDEMITELAYHRADQRQLQKGRKPGDDSFGLFHEEELQALKEEEAALVRQEFKAYKAWEDGGKYDDEQYVRDQLIHVLANEELERIAPYPEFDPDDEDREKAYEQYTRKRTENWDQVYASAATEVDAKSHVERRQELKDNEARTAEEFKQMMADTQGQMRQAYAKDVAGFFFENFFNAFDILFIGLAVFAAYRVGSQHIEDVFTGND